jgi:TPR repeat protein
MAAHYFQLGADKGFPEAISNLASLYMSGFDNTKVNITKAVELLLKVI